jgi:acetyl-CoA carboxylase biotin carboxyl carrier protein
MEIDLKQLRELMRSLKQFDVTELELEKEGERIYLRRGPEGGQPTLMTPMMASIAPTTGSIPPPAPLPDLGAPKSAANDPSLTTITSPFVGTFYRSPSPEAGPFVDVGSEIRPGQVLCIVEAMKLMNEIESEIAGVIVEVAGENGKPVEYGDVLFRVKKS